MARLKIIVPENKIATIQVQIRIGDINYGNHVGNDAFVSLIHEARLQWLQQRNFTELDIEGTGLIMSDLQIEFRNEAFYGEKIVIDISAGDISSVSFDLYYQLGTDRVGKNVLLAKAKTGMVCYDYQQKKIAALPTVLNELLQTLS